MRRTLWEPHSKSPPKHSLDGAPSGFQMIAIGRATRPVTTQTPALFSLFFLGQYWLDDLQRSRVQLLVRPLLARLKGRGIPPNALAPLIADLVEKLPGCGCILKTDGHVGHQI